MEHETGRWHGEHFQAWIHSIPVAEMRSEALCMSGLVAVDMRPEISIEPLQSGLM
jgi:hypothetical protein